MPSNSTDPGGAVPRQPDFQDVLESVMEGHRRLEAIMMRWLGDPMAWFGVKELPSQQDSLAMARETLGIPAGSGDAFYPGLVASDSFLLAGCLQEALAACPVPKIGQKWTLLSNRRLNLLRASGRDLTATEALTLLPKRLTSYGLENLEHVSVIVEERLRERSQSGSLLNAVIQAEGESLATQLFVFNGTPYSRNVDIGLPYYDFGESPLLREAIGDLSRLAENTLREEAGLPNVGEGWIAETRLFRELTEAFPHFQVEQHASPRWLGRQHLDIYFPDIDVAVEYQGAQHDQPVAYFGGEEAFVQQQKRDRRKKGLCTRHGVRLLLVRPGYDFGLVIAQVEQGDAGMSPR